MNRRYFLKAMGVGTLWMLGRGARSTLGAPPAPVPKTRPPATCGGWVDAAGNGSCDRSEKAEKPCGKVTCPGHVKYAGREQAKKDGAPAGTCGLWKDSDKKGFCAVSAADQKPCLYKVCPAHQDHRAAPAKDGSV